MVTAYIVWTFPEKSVKTNVLLYLNESHCEFKWSKYNNILLQRQKFYIKFPGKRERV